MKQRLFFYLVGIFIMGLGVALTIKADLGVGAWDALNVGLENTFGLTIGKWVIIVGVVLLFVNAIIVKGRPKFLAAITFVLIGFSIDFWMLQVFDELIPDSLATKFVILSFGIFMLAMGVAMYLQAEFPVNPIDNLMLSLHERFHFSLMKSRLIGELSALLIAFLLHGPIGIGTIIIALTVGPLIQLCNASFETLFTKKNFG
ncbi:YczE/YyaS/YitT family protein [Metabacillus fastidiosus]|uniref:YczE/YyaS/YitT family protein n=1 Tax=Metabacillus fastidiosus TaxID=1458 RepID=UPI000824540F|nr:YitT family protein [Metabacillus fastidiosus]MED4460968.1 YitT family protein [Metabacillus fastidiosus]MED4533227.1 YitT family protein [Metabacillus fastidiosus]